MKSYLLLIFSILIINISFAKDHTVSNKIIDINIEQKSISEVIKEIELSSHINFSYNNSIINRDSIVNLSFKGRLSELISILLPSGVSFISKKNNIILYKKKPTYKKRQKTNLHTIKKSKEPKKDAILLNKLIPHEIKNPKIPSYINTEYKQPILPENIVSQKAKGNSTEKRSNKRNVKWEIASVYQILDESVKYKYSTPKETSEIVKAAASAEKSSRSKRKGITVSAVLFNIKITSGLTLEKRNECYNYKEFLEQYNTNNYTGNTNLPLKGKNTYKYISIPLMIGYRKDITKRFSAGTNIGIWANILYSKKGFYIDTSKNFPYLEFIKTGPLRNAKTDITADIMLEYNFLRKTYLSFSTSYIHPTSSIYDKNYNISKYISSIGYNFSIIYKF